MQALSLAIPRVHLTAHKLRWCWESLWLWTPLYMSCGVPELSKVVTSPIHTPSGFQGPTVQN